MNGSGSAVWDLLAGGGGFFALSFIVALALGIAALTLLFTGSAVVVLDRFARAARRPTTLAAACVVWSLALTPLALDALHPELRAASWQEKLGLFLRGSVLAVLVVSRAQLWTALLLRGIPARRLAAGVALCLGAGYALLAGGIDHFGYSLAPALAAGGMAGLLGWRRRRRGAGAPGDGERVVRIAGATLACGVAVPLLLPGPSLALSQAGGSLLALLAAVVLLGLLPLAAAGFLDMRGSAEWFVATRYLFAKRRQTFISVITAICVAGVAAGVWLIVTVLSVMNGFERVWRDEIIGNRAHFTVHSPMGPIERYHDVLAVIDASEGVLGASPYVDAEGMVRGAHGEIVGVRVRGIDPARIGSVTDLRADLLPGSEGALEALGGGAASGGEPGQEDPPLVIGSALASALGLQIGDPLLLVSPFGGPPTPLGPGPRLQRFRVAGVFQSSFFQYDEIYTYTSLAAAQDFRRLGDVVNGIEVRTTDFYRSRQVARRVEKALGFPYFTRDWKEFFPAFFQALKTERVMMFVLLTMIMVVAAFAIVVTLVMMIMEKTADIAILKAMGATDAAVERIFAIEGTLIGLLGTALGVVAGVAVTTRLSWVQEQIELVTGIDTLPAEIYQFSTLPSEIDPGQVAVVVAIAMILSLGATLLPSRHGARLDPAEALRSE
jgi:lipoprotein-releasing system permease protein